MITVLTVRHPDYENETEVFGADEVQTLDFDLGASFDSNPDGLDEWADFVEGWLETAGEQEDTQVADALYRLCDDIDIPERGEWTEEMAKEFPRCHERYGMAMMVEGGSL